MRTRQEIEERLQEIQDRLEVCDFRRDFRGGSEWNYERCAEYGREADELRVEQRELWKHFDAVSDEEARAALREVLTAGERLPEWEQLRNMERAAERMSGELALDVASAARWHWSTRRSDAERLADVRALLDGGA